jgi:hypothetical protein
MQEQQGHPWPQAGPKPIIAGGRYLVEQIEAHYPEKIIVGYIISRISQVLHISYLVPS